MLAASNRQRAPRSPHAGARPRRGVALVFVMVFVIAMAALAMSSIFLASNATLLAKSYDRERDLRFSAEAALAMGKARVNGDPSLLIMPADTNFRQIVWGLPLTAANDSAIPGIKVNVFVGLTGSSSGQYGRFASIVAQAVDDRTRSAFVRRLELTQESFAKFAYWTDKESNNGTTIYFNNGDELWGPVWSNDVINIGSGGATFHDQVSTSKTINGQSYGHFVKPPLQNQTAIKLPATTALASLASYAALGNLKFTAKDGPNADERQVLDRIEFVAFDTRRLPGSEGDSTGTDEGFLRWYQGNTGNEAAVRGDWPATTNSNGNPSSVPSASTVTRCGDWHYMPTRTVNGVVVDTGLKFYPASVHGQTWFRDQVQAGLVSRGWTATAAKTYADAEKASTTAQILDNANARCYLAGDPHLVASDRPLNGPRGQPMLGNYTTADIQKGGEDTTFTPVGNYGRWIAPAVAAADSIVKLRPADGRYLHALGRSWNTNAKGVVYVSGNVGISGVVNGLVTLYAKGNIVLLDDIRYSNDPVKGVCHDILGMLSDDDIVIADNAVNAPVGLSTSSSQNYGYRSMDDTRDMFIHGVVMSLGTSFRVEDYNRGADATNGCEGVTNGRGCIYLSGGIIQQARGAVGTSGGTGYAKRYSYDRCAVRNPPPYFPTTGRFQDNRYLELDPVGFSPKSYFQSLQPTTP